MCAIAPEISNSCWYAPEISLFFHFNHIFSLFFTSQIVAIVAQAPFLSLANSSHCLSESRIRFTSLCIGLISSLKGFAISSACHTVFPIVLFPLYPWNTTFSYKEYRLTKLWDITLHNNLSTSISTTRNVIAHHFLVAFSTRIADIF